jgi:hypothetical protein
MENCRAQTVNSGTGGILIGPHMPRAELPCHISCLSLSCKIPYVCTYTEHHIVFERGRGCNLTN